jgi:hypothetical protein
MSTFAVGDKVKAVKQIRENNFNGQETWTHAEPGDTGEIIHRNEWFLPTVRFDRTGTATIVTPTEIEKA